MEQNSAVSGHQESHILVQIMEANNLQPLTPESSLDSFVKIVCGNERHETQVITNTSNPCWNDSFDMYNLLIPPDETRAAGILPLKLPPLPGLSLSRAPGSFLSW